MIATIIISVITCAFTVTLVLFKPSVVFNTKNGREIRFSVFWIAPFVGCIAVLISNVISPAEAWAGLTYDMGSILLTDSTVNPLKIVILFFSMTLISIVLDEAGFFKYLALKTLQKAGESQKRLFVLLYVIVSALTVFTSNDIVILTFTPFICCFCANAKIDPVPYIMAEFVAANTLSMFLIIGNPTNIYLASGYGISFLNYLTAMALPTVMGAVVAFVVLYLLFFKKLQLPIVKSYETPTLTDKPLTVISLVHLIVCIVLLMVSDFIGVQMWFITLISAGSTVLCILLYCAIKKRKPTVLWDSLKRIPWTLAPFVLSMFVIILALEKCGVSAALASFLASGGDELNILSFGLSGVLAANLVNNIPMSVLYSSMAKTGNMKLMGVFASVAGSNVGAYLTPVGALAGIMCVDITNKHGVKFGFLNFAKYGVITAVPTILAVIGGLYISALYIL